MSEKTTTQAILIIGLAIAVAIVFMQYEKNPHLLDLSSQSQHILQNYQNYLQTGKTAIPYNPSPVDYGQIASSNQAGYQSQQAYLNQIATGSLQNQSMNIFGIPTSYMIIAIVVLLFIGVIVSVARK